MEQIKKMLVTALISVVILYFLVMVFLYFYQGKLVYLPDIAGRQIYSTPADIGLSFQDVWLTTEDGTKLHSWFIPAEKNNAVVLFFHGNAGNISHRLESINIFNQIGLSVMIIDYRGYGQSEGVPNEAGTYQDARAAWEYLTKKFASNQIVIFGRSMGGAVATELTRELSAMVGDTSKPVALILESTFTSVPNLGRELYPVFPIGLLATIRYDSLTKMKDIALPVLVIHSPDDEIIPYSHGQALFAAAREPKQFYSLQGDHNNGFRLSPKYPQVLRDFIHRYISI